MPILNNASATLEQTYTVTPTDGTPAFTFNSQVFALGVKSPTINEFMLTYYFIYESSMGDISTYFTESGEQSFEALFYNLQKEALNAFQTGLAQKSYTRFSDLATNFPIRIGCLFFDALTMEGYHREKVFLALEKFRELGILVDKVIIFNRTAVDASLNDRFLIENYMKNMILLTSTDITRFATIQNELTKTLKPQLATAFSIPNTNS